VTAEVKTTCPYCGVGCGVVARPDPADGAAISGDIAHPANFGRLCSKGAALGETLSLEPRLLRPIVDGRETDWGAALDRVATKFMQVVRDHGPDAVALYVSGQLLTEDYYVANKLMKGFIGTANIDTNSRLCMASSVAGHKRAFGEDVVPGNYEDLELADLIVFVGSNAAWCHPVLYQRIVAARQKNPALRIVCIDPRRTATADEADLHLPLLSGSDAALFNGLLSHLALRNPHGAADNAGEALHAASAWTPEHVARTCGVDVGSVTRFFEWFGETEKVVTLYSQGINQSASGSDKVNAIINCHLLTGRIGRPGMGPFSLTGQPNAMGGREVGGLANQLAAHMDIENPAHRALVQRFWGARTMAARPGLKAVELFEAIGRGAVKAVWIMGTNPAVSLPDADRVRAALVGCELVVVSDCVKRTDTAAHAHVLLPALAWGEKDGTVTNSERRISRQRPFLPPPGEARADWRIVCQVAERMGFGAAFGYRRPADIFREHAALSGFENDGSRVFDISALAGLDDESYETLPPLQWPVTARRPAGTARLFADGRFPTADGRPRFLPVAPRAPVNAPDTAYGLVLNTGRVRDQWHTMTRTGWSPRLSEHVSEPVAELHPADAAVAQLAEGALVSISSPWGEMVARVRVSDDQRRGSVFVPMHWNDEFARRGRVGAVVNPAFDPVSGQPELKHTPVALAPFAAQWHGVALLRQPREPADAAYWTKAAIPQGWRYQLAGTQALQDGEGWARALIGVGGDDVEWLVYSDLRLRQHRVAAVRNGRLEGCVFVGPASPAVPRAWLGSLLARPVLSPAERMALLAGRPPSGESETGAVICACFGVDQKRIVQAIRERGAASVEDLGTALKAGTNCGSCRPELAKLLRETAGRALVPSATRRA
jgi:assimilatory nitrate reductase catalytic subunit